MKRSMTRYFALCFLLLAAVHGALLGFFGLRALNEAYRQEINTVWNLAGAVLEAHPEARESFAAALQDGGSCIETGKALLARYGYDAERRLSENPRYQRIKITFLAGLASLFLLLLGFGALFFFLARHKRRFQEETILAVLDQYYSGDFSFLEDSGRQELLDHPHFCDMLVRLGQNLQRKTEVLAQERDHTKTLVTDISHQLKTPIAALKTCFSMYLEADTEAERAEFLSRSMEQIEKLESLTGALINISRLENAMITLRREPVSLKEILISAINGIYHKASQKGIAIDTPDFDDITLELDPKWTAEALMNLLDNAVKYSPPDSGIDIRVQRRYSFVRLEFEDHGAGIPADERNQIFRRFFRGSGETVRRSEGSGVGLYLTRRILEDQGGTVSVKSSPGRGSVFTVQLPL